MNGSRVRWISKLVYNGDANVLLTVRKYYTKRTEKMDLRQIYRAAKKLWNRKVEGIENWGSKKERRNK